MAIRTGLSGTIVVLSRITNRLLSRSFTLEQAAGMSACDYKQGSADSRDYAATTGNRAIERCTLADR